MELLKEGMKAPLFKTKDAFGNTFSSDQLLGKTSVIFFYPKDLTPGCTKEACGFQENLKAFEKKEVQIIGISPDGETSHQKFIAKHELSFTLLTDTNLEICKQFQVYKEKITFGIKALGIERSTFIIDKEGFIIWVERKVKVDGHVDRVLAFIDNLQS